MSSTASLVPPLRRRGRWVPRVSVRGFRLATGLVLLAYVLTHLVNHSLGNVSLAWMEWGLGWASWFWFSKPAQWALYGSLAIHIALGLYALYRRRPFRFGLAESVQLALGLLIPIQLLDHVVATRVAYQLYGTTKGYAQLLHNYFVIAPERALSQTLLLCAIWIHVAIGLHLWLRLKPFYPRVAPALLGLAVLLPALALLGMLQGGREVVRLAADPEWSELHLGQDSLGSPEENNQLALIATWIFRGYLGLVVLTLLARGLRILVQRRRGVLTFTYPGGQIARVPRGTSILEASRLHRIPHASVCGGRGRCSTCRVRVLGDPEGLPEPSASERVVLDRAGLDQDIRLACQLRPHRDCVVAPLLATTGRARPMQGGGQHDALGEERFIVAMFVDMRGSTRFAEGRLPYDTVFVINRFLEAVGSAVTESGGAPNQFLGDGMLALFGIDGPPDRSARQALDAVARIAAHVETLNRTLAPNLDEPVRFGIGVHAGMAILGEIGDRLHGRPVFTAIGDAVNVASRLQGMTKRMGVEAVVSDEVFRAAGVEPGFPREEVEIDGRSGRLWVRPIAQAAGAAVAA